MEIKRLEIRDVMTMMPCLAVLVSANDGRLIHRAGFGFPMPGNPNVNAAPGDVILIDLVGMRTQCDPFSWDTTARTLPLAHQYLVSNWALIPDNSVVDVRVIAGEATEPAPGECV